MDMEIALKKNQSFRLSVELIDRLKQLAKRQNRSLNNYVETVLLDAAYHEPNAVTLEAMEEAASGRLRNEPALNVLRADQPLRELYGLLHGKAIPEESELSHAVTAVLNKGAEIIRLAKEERRKYENG